MDDQITDLHKEPILVLLMLLHLLFDEGYGLGRYVAAIVVEALELPQKGEDGVSDAAA